MILIRMHLHNRVKYIFLFKNIHQHLTRDYVDVHNIILNVYMYIYVSKLVFGH